MESVATTLTSLEQQAKAAALVSRVARPQQVADIDVRLGPDYQGTESLWLKVYVNPELEKASRKDLEVLTAFISSLQDDLLRNGITLFAYSTLEQGT